MASCHVRGMLPIASVGCMLMYRGEKSFFFLPYSHLYLLQSLLAQQEWRTPSLQSRLLDYLKPHFIHPFKNVRERIGRYCTSCVMLAVTYILQPPVCLHRCMPMSYLHFKFCTTQGEKTLSGTLMPCCRQPTR